MLPIILLLRKAVENLSLSRKIELCTCISKKMEHVHYEATEAAIHQIYSL